MFLTFISHVEISFRWQVTSRPTAVVVGGGPCPEDWSELILGTEEESSLFGSAIDKAIGKGWAIEEG